jgi:hypothetical protein
VIDVGFVYAMDKASVASGINVTNVEPVPKIERFLWPNMVEYIPGNVDVDLECPIGARSPIGDVLQ